MFVETQERPAGEPAKVGTLKLSEAIRIGSALREPIMGFMFRSGRSCALGAAYEALGHTPVQFAYQGAPNYEEYSRQYKTLHALYGQSICDEVSARFDGGASREAVADWVESQGF